MKVKKVSYRVIDRFGWAGYPSIEAFVNYRKERKEDPYFVETPIKRILKVTEEEFDEDEIAEVNKKISEEGV